jgi:hypothetical protein
MVGDSAHPASLKLIREFRDAHQEWPNLHYLILESTDAKWLADHGKVYDFLDFASLGFLTTMETVMRRNPFSLTDLYWRGFFYGRDTAGLPAVEELGERAAVVLSELGILPCIPSTSKLSAYSPSCLDFIDLVYSVACQRRSASGLLNVKSATTWHGNPAPAGASVRQLSLGAFLSFAIAMEECQSNKQAPSVVPGVVTLDQSAAELTPPARAIAAAYDLKSEGKPVSVRAACERAGVDRNHLAKRYPEAKQIIEELGEPDRAPRRGVHDRRTGKLDGVDNIEE